MKEQKLTIRRIGNSVKLSSNFTDIETLGLLRLYEQQMSLYLLSSTFTKPVKIKKK